MKKKISWCDLERDPDSIIQLSPKLAFKLGWAAGHYEGCCPSAYTNNAERGWARFVFRSIMEKYGLRVAQKWFKLYDTP